MEQLKIIRTLEELDQLQSSLKDAQYVAYDTETTGLTKEDTIIGFSVCADLETSYYVILSYWDPETQALKTLPTKDGAREFLEFLQTKELIMHNSIFDCSMTANNFGVELIKKVHTDTMILAHLVDENRRIGLKDLGISIFGEDAGKEQAEMKESVTKNAGLLTKAKYELYKADADLLAKYGAKDALLTLKLFYTLVPELIEQGLDSFFYEEESMPLLRGPTYDLNTTGLKVDKDKLEDLKRTLETECSEALAFIHKEIYPHVCKEYPGNKKNNGFNIGSTKQVAWLLFMVLGNDFGTLTKEGRTVCKTLGLDLPYTPKARRQFIQSCIASKGHKYKGPKSSIKDPWTYMQCGKEILAKYADKYKWVSKLLEYSKNKKILNTYVEGIGERLQYGVIRPSFKQAGTTSGRYSSKEPNFQNLPRNDKRVKACIVSRPGKSFIGADYSQLEPRVFASVSEDARLLQTFTGDEDFYSAIGMEVFDKYDCTPQKDGSDDAFGIKYKKLRDIAKVVALSATYGTTAPKLAPTIGKSIHEAQEVIDNYFTRFPSVLNFMLKTHEEVKTTGKTYNLFGRPRRMPEALNIKRVYGNTAHSKLPYEVRNLLNLAVNHKIQSTGASIINRAAIAIIATIEDMVDHAKLWKQVKIVMQVHDELILEAPDEIAAEVASVVKNCMEKTVFLPGVSLVAEPKIAKNLADLK